jgi:hypothetical protein
MRTESEIIDEVTKRKGELDDLYKRFNRDYGIWRLTPFTLGKVSIKGESEYDNYTSNEPRNLANRVMELLATAILQIRIPLQMEGEQERANISNAEKFIYGALNLADSRLRVAVQPSIQEQLAFYATLRGWIGIRAYIHKNTKGETIPDIAVWDILNTTWDTGAYDLLWGCHIRQITKGQAKAEYDIELKAKTAKLYDYWDNEVNAIIVGGKFVKEPEEHGLEHPPILITAVGPPPFIQSEDYQDTIKDVGESIFGSNRNIYGPKNKMMTYLQTLVGQGVHNPMAVSSAGGKKTLEKSPYYKGSIVQLDSEKGEKIEPLFKPTAPQDYDKLIAVITRDLSMGGIPPIAYGELNFQLPGYGIQLLTNAAIAVLAPRQKTMEMSYEWLGRELLTQYADGGFGKLKLHGRDGSNEYFDVELSSKDVKGDWFPEAKLLPSLPEDTAANYAMAQAAVKNELLSKESARDRLLGIQDPDMETQKILREKAMSMPAIMMRRMAAALIKEGRPDLAAIFMDEIEKMSQPQPAKKEAVQPQYATGMPGNVLPPEEMGREQLPPQVREQMTQDLRLRALGLKRG